MPEGPLGGPRPLAQCDLVIKHHVDITPSRIEDEILLDIEKSIATDSKVITLNTDETVNIILDNKSLSIPALKEISDNTSGPLERNGIEIFKTEVSAR